MFSVSLPDRLNANRFIDAKVEVSGPLDPEHYKRFSEMATLLPGGTVSIRGSRVQFGPREVWGKLVCCAEMTCQRCMQPVAVALEGAIRWGLVSSEAEMQSLERGLDPIMLDEGQVLLRQAVEDELVLLLPIMPMHEVCDSGWTPDPKPGDVLKKESPFAVLATLKNKQGS